MAFDPDAFIAGTEQQAPEVVEPTDKKSKFNPSEFIRNTPNYVPSPEPTMVAETEVAVEQPSVSALPAGVMTGPSGMADLTNAAYTASKPFTSAIGEGLSKTAQVYKNNPIMGPAADLLGTSLFGVPPIAGAQSAMSIIDKVKAGKEAATIFG